MRWFKSGRVLDEAFHYFGVFTTHMFSYKVGCVLTVIYGFKFQSVLDSAQEPRSLFTEFFSS